MQRVIVAAGLAIVATGCTADRFTFPAIEFAPAEARLPAARAYVARAAAPGTPLAVAIGAIERAKAYCRPTPPGATIVCEESRVAARSPENEPLGDVVWTVRITPAADGTVASATVDRGRYGN